MIEQLRRLYTKSAPVIWLGIAVFIILVGQSISGEVSDLRSEVDTLKVEGGARQQVIDQLAVNQDALEATAGVTLPSPEEIAEDIAEETGTDAEVIGSSPASPQGERGEAGPIGPIGPTGPGPTDEQILEGVSRYCSNNNRCVGPTGETGDTGPAGEPGLSPTQDQLVLAVATYCGQSQCAGPTGAQGDAGRAPTAEEVAAAVDQYCAARGCVGATGATGAQGPAGADAPAPTQEQINAAVTSYCSVNSCVGPVGPAGPVGPQGEPGREVIDVKVTCTQLTPVSPIECTSEIVYG